MAFTGFNLPDIKDSDLNNEKERRKILEYLFQLTEQLRFVLSNLDEENLSSELVDTIEGAYTTSASVSKELRDANGNISSLKQFANSLTLMVSNGTTSSTIGLVANGIVLASENIVMSGLVSFQSLSTPGQTTIDGANIRTGTIAAERIDVDNLVVKKLAAAEGTFSKLTALTGASITLGGWVITSDGMEYNGGIFDLEYSGGIAKIAGTAPMQVGPFTNNVANTLTLYGSTITLSTSTSNYNMRIWTPSTRESSLTPVTAGTCNIGTGTYYFDYVQAVNHVTISARKHKTDIADAGEFCLDIDALRPVTFKMVNDKKGITHLGFIAEEVEEVCPLLVTYGDDGEPSGLDYSKFVVLLVDEVKKLRKRVADLEEKAV